MSSKSCFLFLCLCLCQIVCAQIKPVLLDQVVVSDLQLKNFTNSKSKQVLNDSIIEKNQASLTSLLNYNSVIYFKENGLGMVSSPSFRGTTAQQTAVIWNGININSQLNGQTDFNKISTRNYNSIVVQAGGSSAIYGSSAIGGSIHLNNELVFKILLDNDLKINYGSFGTSGINYNLKIANKKYSSQFGYSRIDSRNDYNFIDRYDWKGKQEKNLNGQFNNFSFNASFGYKFNSNNCLKFYSETSNFDRNFSLFSEFETKTKYKNNFSRNLLDYQGNFEHSTLNLKMAHFFENYKYFASIDNDFFSFGTAESLIAKIDYGFQVLKNIKINTVLDFNRTKGFGSNIDEKIREIGSFGFLIKQNLSKKWTNEYVLRKEITNNYQSPVLFSAGVNYYFNKFYNLKVNTSRNFRIPTYNDLYYNGAGGTGNLNLKPEKSYQAEIVNVFEYKNISLSQNIYFIKIQDLISWIPAENNNWSPINSARVNTYGSETIFGCKNKIGQHLLNFNATYAYTISKNIETGKQLVFVPFHKFTSSIGYSFKKLMVNYEFLYNGFVFTRSGNDTNNIIKSYKISNIGLDYIFFKSVKIGFQIRNIFNQKYQSVEDRPMPGINFNTYINFKF